MNLLTTWNVSTSVPSLSSFQISTIQMSSRRECSLKMVSRLFSQLQGCYTPNRSVNYIQVSAKSLHRSPWWFSSSTNHTTASKKRKAKLLVHQLSQSTPPPLNGLTSTADLKVYHHVIPWRSTSIVLIREEVLKKLMMIRHASFTHIKES